MWPITVADTLTMTQLIDQGPGLHDFMLLSPDGLHFTIVIERGDVEADDRVFSLLLFQTADVFDRPADIIANLSSSTNDDGIRDVRWLDNNTVTFLGADKINSSQVYAVDRRTRTLRKLTASATKVNAYAVAPGLTRVLYTADADLAAQNKNLRKRGFTVTDQSLTDLLMGNLDPGRLLWRDLD